MVVRSIEVERVITECRELIRLNHFLPRPFFYFFTPPQLCVGVFAKIFCHRSLAIIEILISIQLRVFNFILSFHRLL